LRRMGGGNLMLLSTDKGFHRELDLQTTEEPRVSVHGSFSLHVNYFAMGQYAERTGGRMLACDHGLTSISTVGFVLGEPAGHPDTTLAYRQAVSRFGPDEFFSIKRTFDDPERIPNVDMFLALLRLSGFDAKILLGGMAKLFALLPECSESVRRDFAAACRTAWETFYPIGEPLDFDYQIGAVLAELGAYGDAMECFRASFDRFPENATTAFNIGLCAYFLGDPNTASIQADRALELDPTLEDAKKLQSLLAAAASAG
jgi:tetratricopeptide (TPR) repeat protein